MFYPRIVSTSRSFVVWNFIVANFKVTGTGHWTIIILKSEAFLMAPDFSSFVHATIEISNIYIPFYILENYPSLYFSLYTLGH